MTDRNRETDVLMTQETDGKTEDANKKTGRRHKDGKKQPAFIKTRHQTFRKAQRQTDRQHKVINADREAQEDR